MNAKVSYVAVGLFVLALGVALIASILWISTGGPRQVYDLYVAYMTDSVSGVSRDGAVKYRGVEVGKVSELALDPDNPERVRVLLKIERGTPIKEDTFATLEMQGLTGLAYISLVGGSQQSPPLRAKKGQAYPEIPSKPSRLEQLSTTVFSLLATLAETSSRLSALLDQTNRHELGQTLANLQSFTHMLTSESQTIAQALGDFSVAMRNTQQASVRLPALVAHLDQAAITVTDMANEVAATSLKVTEVGSNFAEAGAKMAEAGTVVTELGSNLNQSITSGGQRLEQFTRDTLPEAQLLVHELRQAAASLRRLIEQLESNPSILLYGAPQPLPGPGE